MNEDAVRQLWQLLDYVAVDYPGAVADGVVTSPAEFAEMREFSSTALRRLDDLPPVTGKEALTAKAQELERAIEGKRPGGEVAALSKNLADAVLRLYPIPLAPLKPPDMARGAAVFSQQCAACHGSQGAGDGPMAAKLDPKPIAFTDAERARQRSVLALYQAVSQGVAGTSMPAFTQLSEADRWAVAFFAGTMSHDDAARQRGASTWAADQALRSRFDGLAALTRSSEAVLAESVDAQTARDVTAYLRASPSAVLGSAPTGLALAKARLHESLAAYESGDKQAATRLALSAYLDGFEPLEPALSGTNKVLLTQVESAMLEYRAAIADGRPSEVAEGARRIQGLFAAVDSELDPAKAEATTAFTGALTILLREGFEALLVVVGMIAFLRKAGRPEVLRHVHVGWISALAAGGLTWFAATYLVSISGASREVTEGVSSVFAAVVLLGVGLWMHQKSASGRWQAYLKDKMSSAMNRRSAYAMAGLAFVAVYREVFETVLFLSALWTQGNGGALLLGLGTAAVILALIGWVLLRTSARVPVGKFFSASSVVVAVLAVILVGKGAKGLQEAGLLDAHPVAFPRLEFFGTYPTAETLAAQIVVALVALVGFWFNRRQSARSRRLVEAT
ncbi:cytochrome c/FTR1 family iron permease [Piscinibacter koreensis]|uniref:cytochrome c/FTR1 family iron permease n=1 Tax=Piscinibacter koreensis TaxID=2742824 RepID=UPI0031591E54